MGDTDPATSSQRGVSIRALLARGDGDCQGGLGESSEDGDFNDTEGIGEADDPCEDNLGICI